MLRDDRTAQVRQIGERCGVRRIRGLGSTARAEEWPDSDVGLIVEYEPGQEGIAFGEFCEEVERLIGRKVDVVTERSLHPLVRDRVLKKAVPL